MLRAFHDDQRQSPPGREVEKAERQRQLEILRGDIDRTKEAEAKLKTEIDPIKDDRKKLAQALLDAAARTRAIEGKAHGDRDTPARVR